MNIAVFMGGTSAEREVSLVSGAAVVQGLREAGHDVTPIDPALGFKPLSENEIINISEVKQLPPQSDDLKNFSNEMIIETIKAKPLKRVDVIFLILHGGVGEDGTIQATLDLAGIPYTGSGVVGSAMAMDKLITKKLFIADNIPTPEFFLLRRGKDTDIGAIDIKIKSRMDYPVIFKPVKQGSSVGLSLVRQMTEIKKALEYGYEYDNLLLIEKFIAGREVTVSILGNQALPIAECKPKSGFYDYEHKYTDGRTEYICPAKLSDDLAKKIQKSGLKAFQSLNCSGFGRVDYRLAEDNSFYCLEVNTLPGMTSHSLVPKAAAAIGMDFPRLLEKICQIAIDGYKNGRV